MRMGDRSQDSREIELSLSMSTIRFLESQIFYIFVISYIGKHISMKQRQPLERYPNLDILAYYWSSLESTRLTFSAYDYVYVLSP